MQARVLLLIGLGSIALLQLVIPNRAAQTPGVEKGSQVPRLELQQLHPNSDARVQVRELAGHGCGYVFFFDSDCPACRRSIQTPDSRPPVQARRGEAFVVWVALDLEQSKIRALTSDLDPRPRVLHPSSEHDLRGLQIPAVPLLWTVQDGVVRHIARGRTQTARAAVRDSELACRAERVGT